MQCLKFMGIAILKNWIIISTFVNRKRSFELVQNEVRYRISLVSKSSIKKVRLRQIT